MRDVLDLTFLACCTRKARAFSRRPVFFTALDPCALVCSNATPRGELSQKNLAYVGSPSLEREKTTAVVVIYYAV